MKNKLANQLISKIVFTGLAIGTLPIHLTLNGKNSAPQEIKNEIQQKIKTIDKAVKGLKFARIFVPIMVIGAGAAFATLVIAGAIALGVVTKKALPKIKWVVKKITENIKEYSNQLRISKLQQEIWQDIIGNLQGTRKPFLGEMNFPSKLANKERFYLYRLDTTNIFTTGKDTTNKILDNTKLSNLEKITELLTEIEKLNPKIKRLKAVITQQKQKKLSQQVKKAIGALSFGALGIAFAGFAGSIAVSLWPIFGLSAALVNKATSGAAWLEQIKKEYPGILTTKQKESLKKFKKISKDTKVQAVIQNLRLETARNTAIAVQMSKYAGLLATLGQKKARKLFLDYFKLKGEESIFQQAIAKDAKTANLLGIQRKLDTIQKKINNMEREHASLKQALRSAFKMYKEQADIILEELKKDILEAQKKESKLQIAPQPVISL